MMLKIYLRPIMQTKIRLIFGVLFSIVVLSSCDPGSCTEYRIKSDLTEDVCVYFYHNVDFNGFRSEPKDTICIEEEDSHQWLQYCIDGGGKFVMDFNGYDSIVFETNSNRIVTTPDGILNTIYDWDDWSISMEKGNAGTKSYTYLYTITGEDLN